MQRRHFLRTLGAAAGAALLARAPAVLGARDADPWLHEFHAALERQPWLAGWRNFDGVALPERALRWHGRPPRGLAGTLYRNGPARFERGGLRYHHWFDGDGLIQAWRIGDGRVSHRARMVGTRKFAAEEAAGRFVRPAAGTRIEGAQPMRNSDDINAANTSVMHLDDRLYALWEGGSAWELDAESLAAKGPRTWRADLESVPFSAHPLRERDGSLWNFGLAAYASDPTLLVWRIGADGELVSITPIKLSMPGYLHSFAMTDRHLVFVISPWLYDRDGSGAFFERLRWRPERGSEAVVVAKDALDAPVRHALPAGLAFHYADAWEERGRLMLRACWLDDADAANRSLAGVMRGRPLDVHAGSQDRFARIELPLAARGRARMHRDGPSLAEFPAWDARHGGPGGRVYLARQSDPAQPYMDTIAAWDARRDRLDEYRYGDGWLAEEHLFVPKSPDARRDQGWLIGTALDSRRRRLCLSVFDAAHVGDGPVCQAALPHTLPLGFHGTFVAA